MVTVEIGGRKGGSRGEYVPSTGKSSNSSSSPRARCFCSGFCCSLGVDCSGSATLGSVVDAILESDDAASFQPSAAGWNCAREAYRKRLENGDGSNVVDGC